MADGVLLDTSYLVAFVDPTRKNHDVARQYFNYFVAESVPMYISSIVVGEFEMWMRITELPLDVFVVLPFNAMDAIIAANLQFTRFKTDALGSRDALKDDFKLLGQAKANDLAFVITDDEHTLYKYSIHLRGEGRLTTRPIKLTDGFNRHHFDPVAQMATPIPGPVQTDLLELFRPLETQTKRPIE